MAKRGKKKEPSRYERVKQILNEVQGDTIPDYQGYRDFWTLPIEKLLKVELYGQRLIAPPEKGDTPGQDESEAGCSCGHCSPAPTSDADAPAAAELNTNCWPTGGPGGGSVLSAGRKRSDRSGLIKGLRGEHPFDGTVFPPLLWNAAREATESEIAFIAAWIDAGCPTSDEDTPTDVIVKENEENEHRARARGDAPHPASDRHINEHRSEVSGLHVRKDVHCLSEEEWGRLREAIACASRYDDYSLDERSYGFWARIHTNSCQHGWEQFLPWHRLYLYFFEQHLQDYDARITLPYWDWSAYDDENKGETEQLDTGVIPEAYRCWLDDDGITRLQDTGLFSTREISRIKKVEGRCNSGLRFLKAADIDYTLEQDPHTGSARWSPKVKAIYDELRRVNSLWFPSRWPGSVGTAAHYPTPDDIDAILSIKNFAGFGGGPVYDHHFGALEEVHNGMHNFSGGVNPCFPPKKDIGIVNPDPQNAENPQYGYMTENRTTAFDPIFWAHHSNVDRLWARWQELNPGVNPEDLDGVLPPWSLSVRDTLSVKKLGYEYMKDACFFPTANHIPITRFNSEKAKVRPGVLDTFRKAQVRLHRVQRGNMPNASIRVFLNAPEANVKTPLDSSQGYVGQVTTFHTYCYGGPGHCDLPLPRTRRFDQRPLHHHEPRNFRLDVTAAVRSLTARGEDEVTVHLVVVGIDGQQVDNALFIDGVSLNFMD